MITVNADIPLSAFAAFSRVFTTDLHDYISLMGLLAAWDY